MPPTIEFIDPPEQGREYAVYVVPHLHRPGQGKLWLHAEEYGGDATELKYWRSVHGETVKVLVNVDPGAWIQATQEGTEPSRRWVIPELS